MTEPAWDFKGLSDSTDMRAQYLGFGALRRMRNRPHQAAIWGLGQRRLGLALGRNRRRFCCIDSGGHRRHAFLRSHGGNRLILLRKLVDIRRQLLRGRVALQWHRRYSTLPPSELVVEEPVHFGRREGRPRQVVDFLPHFVKIAVCGDAILSRCNAGLAPLCCEPQRHSYSAADDPIRFCRCLFHVGNHTPDTPSPSTDLTPGTGLGHVPRACQRVHHSRGRADKATKPLASRITWVPYPDIPGRCKPQQKELADGHPRNTEK
jgi:hypothetical protein